MDIKYLKREEIDKVKWNSCVHYASNGNIFGYMWYLDHIAKDWDALVEGDYESVFPLIWREDFLQRRELYQPDLIRESGVYSIHVLSEARIRAFLSAIPGAYQKATLHLNEQNGIRKGADFDVQPLPNYQLLLSQPYEEMAGAFSRPLLEQLQVAEDAGLVLSSSIKPEQVAEFYKTHTTGKSTSKERRFHGLQRIMYNALHRGWGFASTVMAPGTAELLAVNFFLYSHKKAISLVPVQSPRGQELGALPYLMNGFLRSHANKPMILDFNIEEGQDTELATAMGAQRNPYYKLERNTRLLGVL